MKLAGVVVLYNPDAKVPENIKTYIDSIDILYVVDNSVNNNSSMFNDDKICYISNGKNVGIATALNIAAKRAINDGYEWLLTMDQDSLFHEDGVDQMKEFIERVKSDNFVRKVILTEYDKLGLVSPYHRTSFNTDQHLRGMDSPTTLMTSGNIISLKAYQKIGGFKDWFFIDSVDFDFCLNLRNNKYEIIRLNYIELEHNLGDVVFKKILFKKTFSLNHSPTRMYYIVRNRHYLCDIYKRDFPDYCKLEKAGTFKEAAKIILCEEDKFKKLGSMIKGYFDYRKGVKGEKP